MTTKPFKKSNYVGDEKTLKNYIIDLDSDIRNLFDYVKRFPRIVQQSAEPTLTKGTMGFWKDTDDGKFYLLLNINGTQKKVELV